VNSFPIAERKPSWGKKGRKSTEKNLGDRAGADTASASRSPLRRLPFAVGKRREGDHWRKDERTPCTVEVRYSAECFAAYWRLRACKREVGRSGRGKRRGRGLVCAKTSHLTKGSEIFLRRGRKRREDRVISKEKGTGAVSRRNKIRNPQFRSCARL